MLRLYRRHRRSCRQRSERYRRCACPIYVEGTLRREQIKKSLDLTSWTAATDVIAKWNESGEIGVVKPEIPTIVEAVEKFLADAKARHIGWETARKYENLLQRRFLAWCDAEGYCLLKQIGVEQVREFRASWHDGPNYAAKNLEEGAGVVGGRRRPVSCRRRGSFLANRAGVSLIACVHSSSIVGSIVTRDASCPSQRNEPTLGRLGELLVEQVEVPLACHACRPQEVLDDEDRNCFVGRDDERTLDAWLRVDQVVPALAREAESLLFENPDKCLVGDGGDLRH